MKAVVLYELGSVKIEEIKAIYPRHKKPVDAYAREGKVIAIGTFANIADGSMGVFRSREYAEDFVKHDPFVL